MATLTPPQQNVLRLYHTKREFVFDTWVDNGNPHATKLLKSLPHGPSQAPILHLWGTEGSGRSHLAQACARELIAAQQSTSYLSLSQPNLAPDMLIGLEHFNWVILDDMDAVLSQNDWQTAIIELYHKVLTPPVGNLILITQQPPQVLTGPLADLITRIRSALSIKVDALTDEKSLKKMLMKRAQFRQISLPERSIDFLLTHTERNAKELIHLLDELEQQSLVQKRPISIPFIKTLFERINDN